MDNLHRHICDYFSGKKGRVLDAGAGPGDLAKGLMDMGFAVESCDIDPSEYRYGKCKKADLNERLPYRDSEFDHVVCAEVAEHVENLHHLLRELNRVMKKGGTLAISTPNIANVFSRVKFLLTGKFFCFSDEERRLGHINALTWWEVSEAIKQHGFHLEKLSSNNHLRISDNSDARSVLVRAAARSLYFVLYPIVRPKDKEILKADSLIFFATKK